MLGVVATPDQIWEFIFCLEPEAVTTCFARIDSLLRDRRYQQVSIAYSCSLLGYFRSFAILPTFCQETFWAWHSEI